MYTFTDNFPPPVLDAQKWTAQVVGSASYVVGTPVDGVFPENVDDVNDSVLVDSDNKIFVPAIHEFEYEIGYVGLYNNPAPTTVRTVFLGWRSLLKGSGVPLWGVDVLLKVEAGPTYTFQKQTVEDSVVTLTDLIPDPTSGADGRLRIVRTGASYLIYYYDGGWVLLDTIALGFNSTGFVLFGVFAGPIPEGEDFPWLLQP